MPGLRWLKNRVGIPSAHPGRVSASWSEPIRLCWWHRTRVMGASFAAARWSPKAKSSRRSTDPSRRRPMTRSSGAPGWEPGAAWALLIPPAWSSFWRKNWVSRPYKSPKRDPGPSSWCGKPRPWRYELAIKSIYDVVILGSGPAGLAAAIQAKKTGAEDILIIERDIEPGGILLQCIHNGFGLELFKQDLPGPAYAQRFIDEAFALGVEVLVDAMVLEITPGRRVYATSKRVGFVDIQARAIVLAMGCRERTRAQIRLPGARPVGVYTAGTAQRWVNVEGYMPGKQFVILGSGDIGMIMARRLTFEGAKVERVLEVMPFLTGLTRNYVQCLLDYDIPLQLHHTVKRIIGNDRVEAIESVQIDEQRQPIPGTEETIPCDTLLLSVGLIPENELSRKAGVSLDPVTAGPFVDEKMQTNVPGIFAAGNVVHVYDLVDWVTQAGLLCGRNAAQYAITERKNHGRQVKMKAGDNVRYVVPHVLDKESLAESAQRLQMRVTLPIEEPVWVEVMNGEERVTRKTELYVRPGEMVNIDIPQSAYDAVQRASELSVRIVRR